MASGPAPDPDPVVRAPGVELVGVLDAAGFTDQQFLVNRNGQYVQLTELLFRTLEAIDGHRAYDEIAAIVTERTEYAVTADQVRYLALEKLKPLGLINTETTDHAGLSGGDSGPAAPSADRSLFMVQAPFTLVKRRPIERITSVTRHLFATPLVVALLAAVALSQAWLFLFHGIAYGLLEVLYSPGMILAVLAVVVLGAVVHEFGHASGLRHGGRHAQSIGAGIYLVYPAFFTDVSEGYELPKAARLRTDLGGIYFHLLFTLVLIGLYQVTGWEFLLFTVLLIDLDALRQLLPFGRLDGYWILADLTGIPDPFSQIVPFLRATTVGKRLGGPRLPTLRPWVRRVFIAYIALTIPAVVGFLVLLVARLPNLVGLVWDALRLQVSQVTTAAANAAFETVVLAVLQVVVLAFELLATAYIVLKLGTQVISGLRALSRQGGRLRSIARVLAAAIIVGLVVLWGPHVAGIAAGRAEGVAYVDIASRNHVEGRVSYPLEPPVGGDHAAVWQNCGFYDSEVPVEQAVHSLEHGAVWVTYRPDVAADQGTQLRALVDGRSHVLVSPFPDNPAPVVASAWGRQLEVQDVADPRLEQFIRAFRLGTNAPERGGPCEGGAGEPAVAP